jgi:hypothetical protein
MIRKEPLRWSFSGEPDPVRREKKRQAKDEG